MTITENTTKLSPNHLYGLYDDVKSMLTKRAGVSDATEFASTMLGWGEHLNLHPATKNYLQKVGNQLEILNQGLALPGLFERTEDVLSKTQAMIRSDEWAPKSEALESACLLTHGAAKSAKFFNTANIISYSQTTKNLIQGFYWSPLIIYDGMEFINQMDQEDKLIEERSKMKNENVKWVISHKINITRLKALQSIATIAMGCISLISLIFSFAAQGIIFSPITFLSLASVWVVLNMITYFYENILEREEAVIPSYYRS